MLHSSANPFLWNLDDQNYHGGYHGLNNNRNNDINEKSSNNLTPNTTNPPQPQEKHQNQQNNKNHQQKLNEKHPQADNSNAPKTYNNHDDYNMSENNHIDDDVDVDIQDSQNGIKSPSPPSANGPINLSPKNTPVTATTTTATIDPIQSTSSLSFNNKNNNINNNNNNDYLNDKMHPMDLSGSSVTSSAVDPAPALDQTLSHLSGVLSQLKALEKR